jgi:cytosine/adenosine deaminase-related metal-dependent hydrolase
MILKNATILCGEDFEVVRGYLVIEEDRIKEIGEGRCPHRSGVDLKHGLVFPAFTNAHIHLGDAVAQDYGIYESLIKRVGPEGLKFQVHKRKKEELVRGIRQTLREMLAGGTTAFCDFREGGKEGVELLRSALTEDQDAVILGRPHGGGLEELLELCDGIGISAVADHSWKDLQILAKAVKRKKKLLSIHVAEVEDDLEKALKLDPSFVVHLTNPSEETMEILLDSGVPVVMCPRANATLGAGIPRLRLIKELLVALGTDNVMVNSPCMFREMEFSFKVARGLEKDPSFDAAEVLKAATLNGRKILGRETNAVEEGRIADFIILRKRKYIYDPVVAIIHRYEAGDIRGVVKGNRFFLRRFTA